MRRRRRHVCDISIVTDGQPVREHHVRARARPRRQRALAPRSPSLGAGGGSIVSISRPGEIQVGPAQRGRRTRAGVLRQGRNAQPTMTDAVPADGHPRPRAASPAASCSLDADLARAGVRGAGLEPGPRSSAVALRVPHGAEQHRRGDRGHRDPPRRRPARLLAAGVRRRRADDAARSCWSRRACSSVIVPPHPGLFSALGLLSLRPRLLRQPQRLPVLSARRGRRRRRPVHRRWRTALRQRVWAPASRASVRALRWTPAWSARLGDAVHRRAGRHDRRGRDLER